MSALGIIKLVAGAVLKYWRIGAAVAVIAWSYAHWREFNGLKVEVARLGGENQLLTVLNEMSAHNVEYIARLNRVCVENKDLIELENLAAIEQMELERKEFGEYYDRKIQQLQDIKNDDSDWLDPDSVRILQEFRKEAIDRYQD